MTIARQLPAAATAFAEVAVLASAADRGWLAEADRRVLAAVCARRGRRPPGSRTR